MKQFILSLFLFFPLLLTAQWSVNFKFAGGSLLDTEMEIDQNLYSLNEESKLVHGYFGYSLQAGMDAQYFISPRFGMGTGLSYQYNKFQANFRSLINNEPLYNDSKSVMIPLSFLWSPGKHHKSVLSVGLAAHINLMHDEHYSNMSVEQYPFYTDLRLGYAHRLGKRFEAGLLFSRTLGWYSKTRYYYFVTTGGDISTGYASRDTYYDRYFTSLQLTLSYKLFGNKRK